MNLGIQSRLIDLTIRRPFMGKGLDLFGKMARQATFGHYTPGLTREAYRLLQHTQPGDKIIIGKEGFYCRGEKVAGNQFISSRITKNQLPLGFELST